MDGHYTSILCVLNSTQGQQSLIEQAAHVANCHQARITFQLALKSLPPNASMVMASFAYIESQESIASEAERWLKNAVNALELPDVAETLVSIGTPYVDVIREVSSGHHDLVIAQAAEGLQSFIWSADTMHLLRNCPCPVWLLHKSHISQYKTVLAAVDVNYHYSDEDNEVRRQLNEAVIRSAAEIALLENAALHVVHVYEHVAEHMLRDGLMRESQALIDEALDTLKQQRANELDKLVATLSNCFESKSLEYLKPTSQIVQGYAAEEISRLAESIQADVVVMGTVARVGIPGVIVGNTAENVLNNLDCAVLALKPRGFVTPTLG